MTSSGEKKWKNLSEFLATEVQAIQQRLEDVDPKLFESINRFEEEKGRFISNYRRIPLRSESFLFVLRKWNSFTPSLPVMTAGQQSLAQHSVGGGYFIHLQSEDSINLRSGYGLVIDPGYNFVHNFGLAGFSLDDIDGVLITHAHNDHTNDFESLLSILYQRNSRYSNNRSNKKIDLFFNLGSFKKFSNYLDLSSQSEKSYIGNVKVLSPGEVITIPDRDDIQCNIVSLFCKHHEIVTAGYSLGLCISIGDRNILFTGDTGWSYEIIEKNDKILMDNGIINQAEMKIDVLVSHIGTIKENEFEVARLRDPSSLFYDKHLGILGTLSFIYHYKPELCIISEFGEELTALRQPLAEEMGKIAQKIRSECCCLPGDVGLAAFLDTKTSIDYHNRNIIEWKNVNYADIEEISGQRNIVFYSNAVKYEEGLFRDVVIGKGLDIYRNHYKNQILHKMGAEGADNFALMRDVAAFRFDPSDPWATEESQAAINDLLIALSCTLDSPAEILSLLLAECHVWSILTFLEAYHLGNKLLVDFAMVAETFGYGLPEDEKLFIERLISKDASGFLRECMECYLGNDFDGAKSALEKAAGVTIYTVWPKLSLEDKVKALLEDHTIGSVNAIDKSAKIVGDLISRHNNIRANLASMIEAVKAKYFAADDRCWRGTHEIGITELEQESDSVDAGLKYEFKNDLERVKSFKDLVDAIEPELHAATIAIHSFLQSIGQDFVVGDGEFSDTLQGVLVLSLLAAERKISPKQCSNFLEMVENIMRKRELASD